MPMLIIFSGLPGTGKTTIARELARQIGAAYVRIDTLEQALRDSGALANPLSDAGYRAAYTIAEENLKLGSSVVADSVNPLAITRQAWHEVAQRSAAGALDVELICSDAKEHRRRVETRASDIAGLVPPTWEEVVAREYEPWDGERLVIDAAVEGVETAIFRIRRELEKRATA